MERSRLRLAAMVAAFGLGTGATMLAGAARNAATPPYGSDLPNKGFVANVASDEPRTPPTTPQGTITIAGIQFESWDPHVATFAQDVAHVYMVNRGLYMLDLHGRPQPSLAAEMPAVSAGGKVYTAKLKPGIKWSDGTPVTAEQFVAGVQRACNPDLGAAYAYQHLDALKGCLEYANARGAAPAEKEALRNAVGAKAVDAATVEYTLTAPRPAFTTILAMWSTFPTPTQRVTAVDGKWPGPLEGAYTGPYMPTAYVARARMELGPNPNWIGTPVKTGKIVIRYIDDLAVATQAYRAGEVDATSVSSADVPVIVADGTLSNELHMFPQSRTVGLQFNQRAGKPGAKTDVRLAFSQAVDRDLMNQVVFKGAQTPTTNWMPPNRSGVPFDTYAADIGFDVTKARASLARAGYPGGAGFPSLTLLQNDTALTRSLGAFLASEWGTHLGVDIKLEFVSSRTRTERYNSGDFQLVVGGWAEDYPDPENWFVGLREVGGSFNKEGCGTPELDAIIAKAKVNPDDDQRRQQYRDAEKLAITTVQCNAPLWHTTGLRMVKPYISGMVESQRASDTFVMGDWDPENWSTTRR